MQQTFIEQVVYIPTLKDEIEKSGRQVLSRYLHPEEDKRLVGLKNPKKAWEWLGGRVAAKMALRCFVNEERGHDTLLNEIVLRNDKSGKPVCNCQGVHISISHRESMAVAAIADQTRWDGIGIDLEVIEPKEPAMWEQFFTLGEQELALKMARERGVEESTYFSHLWAIKEAVLKALGLGLRVDSRQVEIVDLSPEGKAEVVLHNVVPDEGSDKNTASISAWVEEKAGYVIARSTLNKYNS